MKAPDSGRAGPSAPSAPLNGFSHRPAQAPWRGAGDRTDRVSHPAYRLDREAGAPQGFRRRGEAATLRRRASRHKRCLQPIAMEANRSPMRRIPSVGFSWSRPCSSV